MELHAKIHQVSTGHHDLPLFHFSLHDGEDSGQVSFMDEIGLAHATFLIEHGIVEGDSAYAKMLQAIVECEPDNAALLLGAEFDSGLDDVEHDNAG
jgi:hypothetical protein